MVASPFLLGDLTMRGLNFSSLSGVTGLGFVSVSNLLWRAFWDLELRLPSGLDRISLLSGLGLPTTVTVGLATSSDEFSFSMAMLAASYARLWTMELQKRIVSVASSRVRLLEFAPPTSSRTMVKSSEIHKRS